jgi:hypothetical protein
MALLVAIPLRLSAQDSAQAQQAGTAASAVSVEAAVGTGIAERALTGEAQTFKAAETSKLFCFSRISGATNSDVEHVWYHGSEEVGRVKLHVGGSPWRTHSNKTLGDNPTGDWRCDVVQDGKVLQTVNFKVE